MNHARLMLLSLVAALLLVPLMASSGMAQEESILDFRSHIQINADATMTVTETITVNAMGWAIKRGIYRDLWTRYKDRHGNDYRVDYEFTQVLRDGQPEPHHTEDSNDSVRLYIGDAGVLIPHGQHTYTITYTTSRQIGYFEDYDEIYWNVTGNNWDFTIQRAEVTIDLPPGAEPLQWAAYTGAWGEQGISYRQDTDSQGNLRFTTTAPLYPRSGLTVAVAWPKGLVAEPTRGERFRYLLRDNMYLIVGLAGQLLLLCYFLSAWIFVGRDPAKGTIIPLFGPPDNMSPAEVRFVSRMGFDNKCLAANLVDMAVKGHVTIDEETKGSYALTRTDAGTVPLTPDEEAVFTKLMRKKKSLELKNKNHARISGAIAALKTKLVKTHHGMLFHANSGWFGIGVLMAIVTYLVSGLFVHEALVHIIVGIVLGGWTSVGALMLLSFLHDMLFVPAEARKAKFPTTSLVIAVVFLGIGLVAFLIIHSVGQMTTSYFLLPVGLLLTLILFYNLIKAPTKLGRHVMDQIDGFRMYLETAEQDRLSALNPPERTPELFEKFLPYALALDVEVGWCEQFNTILQRAATAENATYQPDWYTGTHWHSLGAMGLASSLGSSLNSAVTSSSAAPGSSSGSGGGGFSGGGGGGGGGGGW